MQDFPTAKEQRVRNQWCQNDQKQIGPGDIICQVNQAASRQRKLIRKRKTTTHTIKRFQQVADQAQEQRPAFHPPDRAEIIDNTRMHSGKKTDDHPEREKSVEKHDQPSLDRRDDRLHEATNEIDDATTQADSAAIPVAPPSQREACSKILPVRNSSPPGPGSFWHQPLTGALRLIAVVKPRRGRKQSERQHFIDLLIRQSVSVSR